MMTNVSCHSAGNVAQLYHSYLRALIHFGQRVGSRNGPARELLNVHLELSDPGRNVLFHPLRNLNYRFMIAEWLWIAFGRNDLATIARYNREYARYSDDGLTLAGAYGPPFLQQWPFLLGELLQGATRRALISPWRPSPSLTSRDVPCTVSWQFIPRLGRLHLLATMRSSDAWLGLPYDIFTFTQLQAMAAGALRLDLGAFWLNLASAHIYQEHVPLASELLRIPQEFGHAVSPRLPGYPPQELHDVLVDGRSTAELPFPWERYARALRATNRADAWRELDGGEV